MIANPLANPAIVAPTVPVVTLSKEIDIKFLEQLKLEFKKTIKRNK